MVRVKKEISFSEMGCSHHQQKRRGTGHKESKSTKSEPLIEVAIEICIRGKSLWKEAITSGYSIEDHWIITTPNNPYGVGVLRFIINQWPKV